MSVVKRRNSKYASLVMHSLRDFGHATNAQLADDLRRSYPHLSDTTVHRITQRFLEDGEVQLAPHAVDGAMVFDTNTTPHDHFECSYCGGLQDITLPKNLRVEIRQTIGKCKLNGSLKITGECCDCMK
jgi:Fur family peroxide stress response transcriptional regulator